MLGYPKKMKGNWPKDGESDVIDGILPLNWAEQTTTNQGVYLYPDPLDPSHAENSSDRPPLVDLLVQTIKGNGLVEVVARSCSTSLPGTRAVLLPALGYWRVALFSLALCRPTASALGSIGSVVVSSARLPPSLGCFGRS